MKFVIAKWRVELPEAWEAFSFKELGTTEEEWGRLSHVEQLHAVQLASAKVAKPSVVVDSFRVEP